MGNVCGCVRAEKEEQYLDPAKTPLSPEKYSPRRKYFRRKPIKTIIGDRESVEPNKQNEGKKKSGVQLSEEQPALLPRGLVPEDAVVPDPTLDVGIPHPQGKTRVVVDSVKQKLVPSAAGSLSHYVDTSANDGDREVKVSDLEERIPETDSTPCCVKRKEHLNDASRREITFQRKTDILMLPKAASLSSIHYGTERSFEKSGFSEDPSKNNSSVQGKQNTERFCPCEIYHFHFEKKRCHSLCTIVSSASKDTDGNEVSEMWSLSLRCK